MGHGHDCHCGPANFDRAFAIGILLNLAYLLLEAGAGFWSGSLALLADAGHNLGDVLSLLIAWSASRLARRQPTPLRTYGLGRTTILASLASGLLLLVAVGAIAWEAVERLRSPVEVPGLVILAVAGVGAVINALTAYLFASGRHGDMNIRGAYLHMAADAGVSIGVVLSGLLVWKTGWLWLDPAISLVVAAIVLLSTWNLLKEATHLAVDGVPAGIDPSDVRAYLSGLSGIVDVHDLHIWGLSTTSVALTVHLVSPRERIDDARLGQIAHELDERFGIDHATIQVESTACESACEPPPARPATS